MFDKILTKKKKSKKNKLLKTMNEDISSSRLEADTKE